MAGEDGLRAGFRTGTHYIDLSTNSPALVRKLSADLAGIGVSMLDAPVSGGPKGAASRKLAIWVSGEQATYDACKPILDQIGDQVRYLGASGNASVAKLVHNCANYGIQMVLAEAFTMGVKAGVSPEALLSAVQNGAYGQGMMLKGMLPKMVFKGNFDRVTFALKLARKDLGLATEVGRETNTPMPLASTKNASTTAASAAMPTFFTSNVPLYHRCCVTGAVLPALCS